MASVAKAHLPHLQVNRRVMDSGAWAQRLCECACRAAIVAYLAHIVFTRPREIGLYSDFCYFTLFCRYFLRSLILLLQRKCRFINIIHIFFIILKVLRSRLKGTLHLPLRQYFNC